MAKESLIAIIRERLLAELAALQRSAKEAHAAATHPDAKAENKYDTRGLESSYLAGAQKERAMLLEGQVLWLDNYTPASRVSQDVVGLGSLIEVQCDEVKSFLFILPVGGGYLLPWRTHEVKVITPQSPLGQALLGKEAGDELVCQTPQGLKNYEILALV